MSPPPISPGARASCSASPQTSQTGPGGKAPKLLLICPPPILDHHGEATDVAEMFIGGYRKSLAMAERYALVAKEHGAAFLKRRRSHQEQRL